MRSKFNEFHGFPKDVPISSPRAQVFSFLSFPLLSFSCSLRFPPFDLSTTPGCCCWRPNRHGWAAQQESTSSSTHMQHRNNQRMYSYPRSISGRRRWTCSSTSRRTAQRWVCRHRCVDRGGPRQRRHLGQKCLHDTPCPRAWTIVPTSGSPLGHEVSKRLCLKPNQDTPLRSSRPSRNGHSRWPLFSSTAYYASRNDIWPCRGMAWRVLEFQQQCSQPHSSTGGSLPILHGGTWWCFPRLSFQKVWQYRGERSKPGHAILSSAGKQVSERPFLEWERWSERRACPGGCEQNLFFLLCSREWSRRCWGPTRTLPRWFGESQTWRPCPLETWIFSRGQRRLGVGGRLVLVSAGLVESAPGFPRFFWSQSVEGQLEFVLVSPCFLLISKPLNTNHFSSFKTYFIFGIILTVQWNALTDHNY